MATHEGEARKLGKGTANTMCPCRLGEKAMLGMQMQGHMRWRSAGSRGADVAFPRGISPM